MEVEMSEHDDTEGTAEVSAQVGETEVPDNATVTPTAETPPVAPAEVPVTPTAETPPAAPAAAPVIPPTEPAVKPVRMNPVHIVLPIVLMVVALAGIIGPLLYAHGVGMGSSGMYPGSYRQGSGQNQGQNQGQTRPSFSPGNRPSGFPSGMVPSTRPTVMPTVVPTAGSGGSGPTYCQNGQCFQPGQRGLGQRGPSWPRGNRTMNGLSGAEIALVSASSVVFVGGVVYLVVALRRRSALRKRALQ